MMEAVLDLAPVRAHLADRLASFGGAPGADALVERARGASVPGHLANAAGLSNAQLAALAMMIAAAEEGRHADALALSAFGIERRPPPPVRRFLDQLEAAAERPAGPLRDARGRPVVFVVSFPRSGNTRFLNIMAGAFPGSRFTAFLNEGRYVSPHGWGIAASGPVFVKDHVLQEAYRENPVIYIARDGRDCCLSYNDFKLRRPDADTAAIAEGADSLARIVEGGDDGPAFGGWPAHMSRALDWRDMGAPLTLLRYDAMMGEDAFATIAAALATAAISFSEELYAVGLRNAEAREDALRRANPTWGRERIYPAGSMMDRWLDTPGASKWRTLLGPHDKARLNAAGFTAPLIRAGFEEDPLWWQK